MPTKEIYHFGETPPVGVIPPLMYAAVIRQDRFGPPSGAFAIERVPVPIPKNHQVLVWVMAAGVNYNNVWAALGHPLDVIARRLRNGAKENYHIGGSDASGIVWAIGERVTNVGPGDRVVLSCGMWDESSDDVRAGKDPITSRTARIWGFEENWGAFAQFALVDDYQCLPKPDHLTWEESAAYMLVGATAWRMLHGWPPHSVQPGDPVLIWGGAGGLGSLAIQIVNIAGGIPVAVVSDDAKASFCIQLGARGVLNRRNYDHWGRLPDVDDAAAFTKWTAQAAAFAREFRQVIGRDSAPRIVFEHPGEETLPTSVFVCDNNGMIVICAGTSGYNGDVELRYLWTRQKRLQGSHFANPEQCRQLNEMVRAKRIDPALSQVYPITEVGYCHQLMYENRHPPGNMAILVNAIAPGSGRTA